MTRERFEERKQDVRKASARLIESVNIPEDEVVRDAVIQRFEFTFEVIWKTLKLYLERQGFETGGPRQTLKKAFIEGLIQTPEEADIWFRMLDDRNQTSHIYKEDLALEIYRRVVADYAGLLNHMGERVQTLAWD